MKRIVEIPDNVVKAIQNGEDYRYDIHTAIAQSTPYNPSGDLVSREDLIREIGRTDEWYKGRSICNIIDNAQTVEPRDNFDLGYVKGLNDAKSDIITLIANEYTSHGELIPNWLTIGETKVSDRQKKGGTE